MLQMVLGTSVMGVCVHMVVLVVDRRGSSIGFVDGIFHYRCVVGLGSVRKSCGRRQIVMQSAVVMQSTAVVQSTPPLDLWLVGGPLTIQLVVIVTVTG